MEERGTKAYIFIQKSYELSNVTSESIICKDSNVRIPSYLYGKGGNISELKCLYIVPKPGFFRLHQGTGGHITHAVNIIHGLKEYGCEVVLVGDTTDSHNILSDLSHYHILHIDRIPLLSRITWNNRLLSSIDNILEKERPDFVYIRYSAGFIFSFGEFFEKIDVPTILEVNSLVGLNKVKHFTSFISSIQRKIIYRSDLIVTVSDEWANRIDPKMNLRNEKRLLTIPNGIGLNYLKLVNQACEKTKIKYKNKKDKSFRMAYFGILKNSYDLEWVIDVLMRIKPEDLRLLNNTNIIFDIFGSGPEEEKLKRKIGKNGKIVQVNLRGHIPHNQVPKKIVDYDLLLLPLSHFGKRGSPLKLFEYMAAGKAILASKVGQVDEIITHDVDGLLYEIHNEQDFLSKFQRLVNDNTLRKKIGENARELCLAEYTYDRNVKRILEKVSSCK